MQESARQWRPPVKQKVRQLVADKPDVHIVHRDKDKRISQQEYTLPKRRQAIELTIGRLKSDNRMDRSYHKSETGD